MQSVVERLVDANIAVLEKAAEHTMRGKTLKAEFVRDDGSGGKYYGYMRGGKVHVIHARGRGKWGSAIPYKQQVGAEEGSMDAPESSPDKAMDFGGDKVSHWRADAKKIMGEAQPGVQGQGEREAGAVEPEGGGGAAAEGGIAVPEGGQIQEGLTTKPQTKLENILARLAEAEAQYIKVMGDKDYQRAYQIAIDKAKESFREGVLERIRRLTGHDIIYDPNQNQFRYRKPMGGTTNLSPRDRSIVDKVVEKYIEEANRIIKAKTTAVRRAEGSDE